MRGISTQCARLAVMPTMAFMLCAAADYQLVPVPRTVKPIEEGVDIGVQKVAHKGDALLVGHIYDTSFITVISPVSAIVGGKPVKLSIEDRLTLNIPTNDLRVDGKIVGNVFCDDTQRFKAKGLFEYTNKMKPIRAVNYPKICFIDTNGNNTLDKAFWFDGYIPKSGFDFVDIGEVGYVSKKLQREVNNLLVKVVFSKTIGSRGSFMLSLAVDGGNLYYDMNYFVSYVGGVASESGSMLFVDSKSNSLPYRSDRFLGSSITVSAVDSSRSSISYVVNKNFDSQLFTYGNVQPQIIHLYLP